MQDENAFLLHGAAGHAGLFTNTRDLLTLAREILAAGGDSAVGDDARLYLPSTVELFAERQAPEGSTRALGRDTPGENSSSGRHFSSRSSATWVTAVARCGSIASRGLRWCC